MTPKEITQLTQRIQQDYTNIKGIVVRQYDKTALELYVNGGNQTSKLHVYSITKSILSILIGIAIDKGYIQSIDVCISEFFPEVVETENNKGITIKDLLTMSVDIPQDETSFIHYFKSDDHLHFTLQALNEATRIDGFSYSPIIGPDILSGVIMKSTGRSVLDFANEYLFEPLGINGKTDILVESEEAQYAFYQSTVMNGWVMDALGLHSAGWGLTLTPMEMAKIGQLYVNKGMWNGVELVSNKWMKKSIQQHNHWQEMDLAYGYLWWILDEENSIYAAMGDGGNIIYVNEKYQLVISVASGFQPDVMDRIAFIQAFIEPYFV